MNYSRKELCNRFFHADGPGKKEKKLLLPFFPYNDSRRIIKVKQLTNSVVVIRKLEEKFKFYTLALSCFKTT